MAYGVTNSGKFDISSKKVFGRKKGVWQQTNQLQKSYQSNPRTKFKEREKILTKCSYKEREDLTEKVLAVFEFDV